jgi:hypothetical protein
METPSLVVSEFRTLEAYVDPEIALVTVLINLNRSVFRFWIDTVTQMPLSSVEPFLPPYSASVVSSTFG